MVSGSKIGTVAFIVGDKHEQEMHPDDKRRAPQAASEAYDMAQDLDLKEVAALRRAEIKLRRFTIRDSPEFHEQSARIRSMRRNMERRINRY